MDKLSTAIIFSVNFAVLQDSFEVESRFFLLDDEIFRDTESNKDNNGPQELMRHLLPSQELMKSDEAANVRNIVESGAEFNFVFIQGVKDINKNSLRTSRSTVLK